MFKALVKAGAVSDANAVDHRKVDVQRAARTDAGVHAAGNVYVPLTTPISSVTDNQDLPQNDCSTTTTRRTPKPG
jgi:tRNA U38,U39,U40 pseudouridine synthase TruA